MQHSHRAFSLFYVNVFLTFFSSSSCCVIHIVNVLMYILSFWGLNIFLSLTRNSFSAHNITHIIIILYGMFILQNVRHDKKILLATIHEEEKKRNKKRFYFVLLRNRLFTYSTSGREII
jgi:hypothetical protein